MSAHIDAFSQSAHHQQLVAIALVQRLHQLLCALLAFGCAVSCAHDAHHVRGVEVGGAQLVEHQWSIGTRHEALWIVAGAV